MLIDVLGDDVSLLSVDLSVDLRTAPTRSFAKRDHDSIRLCANQQAAGPSPLIFVCHSCSFRSFEILRSSLRPAPIVRRISRMNISNFLNPAQIVLLNVWKPSKMFVYLQTKKVKAK